MRVRWWKYKFLETNEGTCFSVRFIHHANFVFSFTPMTNMSIFILAFLVFNANREINCLSKNSSRFCEHTNYTAAIFFFNPCVNWTRQINRRFRKYTLFRPMNHASLHYHLFSTPKRADIGEIFISEEYSLTFMVHARTSDREWNSNSFFNEIIMLEWVCSFCCKSDWLWVAKSTN